MVEYDRDSPQFRELIANSKFNAYRDFAAMRDAVIDLQDRGFPVSFRNTKIRELPSAPASELNPYIAAHTAKHGLCAGGKEKFA